MEEYKVVIGLGALAAYLIKWAQNSDWKALSWITAEAKRVNLIVQAVISFFVSLGIGYTWDAQAHSLLITNLSLASIFHGAIGWLSQFAVQHGFTNLITLGNGNGGNARLSASPSEGKALPAASQGG